jgi:twitching motility protein PilJ
MVASLGQVSKSAEASASAAQEVFEHLSASDRAVQATAQGMSRIDGAVSETAEKMRLLGVRSGEVFEIIDLIEEIASRSELLSMNAAIEAAHAGDAGRGFGVVADEIRNLSERSTEAIRSVTGIVKGMSAEMQAVLAAMETSTREVKQGLDLSEQARRGLGEISVIVQRATDLAGEISGATREQTSASQTVSEAMQLIANITEQSTAGSNETARAVRDLVSLSEHLTTAISRFRIDAPEDLSSAEGDQPQTAQALGEVARQLARVAERLEPESRSAAPPAAEAPETPSKDGRETSRRPTPAREDLAALVKKVGEIIGRLSRPS